MQKAQRIQAFKGAGKGLFRRGLGIAGQVGGMFGSGLAIGGGGVVASALGTLIAPAATNAETATRTNVAKVTAWTWPRLMPGILWRSSTT